MERTNVAPLGVEEPLPVHDPTSERFKTILGHIMAASPEAPLEEPFVDLWFDYQIWRRRSAFCNGVAILCGDWMHRSIRLGENFGLILRLTNLQTLPEIPSAIFAHYNPNDEPRLLRDLIIPWLFHFRLSRTPPVLLLMGRYRSPTAPSGNTPFLEFSQTNDSERWLQARAGSLMGNIINVVDLQISGPKSDLEESGPSYVLYAAELAIRNLS